MTPIDALKMINDVLTAARKATVIAKEAVTEADRTSLRRHAEDLCRDLIGAASEKTVARIYDSLLDVFEAGYACAVADSVAGKLKTEIADLRATAADVSKAVA